MQKMCNIDSPLAGVVLASRVMQSGVPSRSAAIAASVLSSKSV